MSETQPISDKSFLRVAANAVKARLFDADRETKLVVSELLSYEVAGAARSDAFKAKRWDGRSTFFDFATGTFPAGFVSRVQRELARLGHKVQVLQKPLPGALGPEVGTVDYLGHGFSDRYDYQPETVRALLRHGSMIARVATGGGKSGIAVLAVGTIKRPSLFLTTRTVLAHQMADTFEKAGMTPGFMGDGVWAPRRGVNIGMVQTISQRLTEGHPEREKMLKILSYFEFVMGEEAHEASGGDYSEIMNKCPNAHYRLALTATPFMRADEEANMRLMAVFGSIGMDVSEETLIARGILARPVFKIMRTPTPPMLRRRTTWPTCYELGVVENAERNRLIIQEVLRASAVGLPAMVLIQRKRHGHILDASLAAAGLRTKFIFGDSDQGARKSALEDLKRRRLDVLIGSTILDVGVDVPAVGLVVLAGAGKAEVAHRQRIGRGLREKKDGGPNVCYILDFDDACNHTLQEHALARRGILEQTPGFAENILRGEGDFSYDGWRH